MKRLIFIFFLFGILVPAEGFGQSALLVDGPHVFSVPDGESPAYPPSTPGARTRPQPSSTSQLPLMSPELALSTYQDRSAQQAAQLSSYSALTVVRAELPDSSQQGELELQRKFEAPHSLQFTPVHYTGDGFVKNNVITRLLQSEVEHVQKDDPSLTAITPANYKFSYKGASWVGDRMVHVFQLKPHNRRMGLFKGRIYLDAHTGALVRAEGTLVKSPSFFVKHVDFWQDYADIQSFTFPVHIHSEAKARIVGRAIVDIVHRDYQPISGAAPVASAPPMPAL